MPTSKEENVTLVIVSFLATFVLFTYPLTLSERYDNIIWIFSSNTMNSHRWHKRRRRRNTCQWSKKSLKTVFLQSWCKCEKLYILFQSKNQNEMDSSAKSVLVTTEHLAWLNCSVLISIFGSASFHECHNPFKKFVHVQNL